jgi:hypothetical protein
MLRASSKFNIDLFRWFGFSEDVITPLYQPVREIKYRMLQFSNLKCCIKAKEPLKLLFNGVLVLIYYFKKYFKASFLILKTFCSTLDSRIGEFDF